VIGIFFERPKKLEMPTQFSRFSNHILWPMQSASRCESRWTGRVPNLEQTNWKPIRQWRKQLLRTFGPELIRINELINSLIKTARSAVSKNRAERSFFFFPASAAKHDISSASQRAFPGFFGDIFGCSTLSQKRCFRAQEFTRFLSTVSSQRWAVISRIWEKSVRLQVGWAQVSTHNCWWLVNRVTQT